jgi:hypothetical protein
MRFLLTMLLAGCSVALGTKPTTPPRSDVACTTHPAFWILDGVATAGAIGTAVVGGTTVGGQTGQAMAGLGAIAAIVLYASADNGYHWVTQCKAQRETPTATAER